MKVKVFSKEVNILEGVYEFCPGKDIVVSGESGPVRSHAEIRKAGIRSRQSRGGRGSRSPLQEKVENSQDQNDPGRVEK